MPITVQRDASPSVSPWHPLRIPIFRNLLIADLVSDVGTFMQTVGAALLMTKLSAPPRFISIFPDLVKREDLSPALALNGIEFNLARAVGPGLAGLIIAAVGVTTAFVLNAVSFLGVIFVIARWKYPARKRRLPAETISGATFAAIRYVRYSPSIRTLLVRAGCVIFCTSAFWALLPTAAKNLNKSSIGYGLLLAFLGVGAVLGAVALQRARSTLSMETLLTSATAIFGAVVLATGTMRSLGLLCVLMSLGGASWIVFMSLFNTLIQNLAPDWVRARVLAVYLFVYQGSVAIGSAIWGYAAEHSSANRALVFSSAAVAACLFLRIPFRLPE